VTYLDNEIVLLSRRAEGLVWRSRNRRLVEYFKVLVNGGLGSDELINRAVALVSWRDGPMLPRLYVARPLLGNGAVLIVFMRICIGQAFGRHLHF
jgi:hypothetical protein